MAVSFTPRALRNLAAIRAYIADDKPLAASRVAVELVAACDRLDIYAERGRPGRKLGTRELTSVWPYVIVYRVKGRNVEILAILHGAQQNLR